MPDEPKYAIGVDWGEGQARSVGMLVKVEGETIGVLQTFELGDREVQRLKELDAPKDFIIPAKMSGTLPITNLVVCEKLLRGAGLLEPEPPPPPNRAQRRAKRRKK